MLNRNLLLLSLVAAATQSQAIVAANTFGLGNTFNAGQGWAVGLVGSNLFEDGMRFTSAASGVTTQYTIAIMNGATGGVNLNLYTVSGGLPGTLLETVSTGPNTPGGIITVASNGVALTAATDYILTLSIGNPTQNVGWCLTSPAVNGPGAFRVNSGAWQFNNFAPQSAYRVEVVPEPATFAGLGLGVAALIRRRRK